MDKRAPFTEAGHRLASISSYSLILERYHRLSYFLPIVALLRAFRASVSMPSRLRLCSKAGQLPERHMLQAAHCGRRFSRAYRISPEQTELGIKCPHWRLLPVRERAGQVKQSLPYRLNVISLHNCHNLCFSLLTLSLARFLRGDLRLIGEGFIPPCL